MIRCHVESVQLPIGFKASTLATSSRSSPKLDARRGTRRNTTLLRRLGDHHPNFDAAPAERTRSDRMVQQGEAPGLT